MFIIEFLLLGIFAGSVSGLLGLGGGTIVVPVLAWIFIHQGVPHAMVFHLAVGTSFAVMIVTTLSSAWQRARQGNVNWHIVKRFTPGLLVGVILGSLLASHLSTNILKIAFAVFLIIIALRIFFLAKPKATRNLPGNSLLLFFSTIIGILSGVLGIGIGSVSVPYFIRHNVPMRFAAGIASACTVPLAVFGAASFILIGWQHTGVSHNFGYVDWLAFLLVGVSSVIVAPLTAKLALRLKTSLLKRIFAVFLLLIAAGLIWGL